MKIVCYGASVTAQKFKTGYFENLKEVLKSKKHTLGRVAFGGSHFEYAGYACIRDVLEKKPDICIIDWLTPSMKGFSEFKIDLLNSALISHDCIPIWFYFPRVSNFDIESNAYNQVLSSCKKFGVDFIDVRSKLLDFKKDPTVYLRDDVHTTEQGAIVYSKTIFEKLTEIEIEFQEKLKKLKSTPTFNNSSEYFLPNIYKIDYTIKDTQALGFEFEHDGNRLEIFFETEVGPHLSYLNMIIEDSKNEIVVDKIFNNADPWSYYKRPMVVETLRQHLSRGHYKAQVRKFPGNPFDEKQTKKPLVETWLDEDRYFELRRMSINADVKDIVYR